MTRYAGSWFAIRIFSQSSTFALILLVLFLAGPAVQTCRGEDRELSQAIQQLDTKVVPVEQREAVANQVELQQQARLKQANLASSLAWKAISSEAGWLDFRQQKLLALERSLSRRRVSRTIDHRRPVTARTVGQIAGDGFVIERLLYPSESGTWVSANLYRPALEQKLMPGIIIAHAHHTPKEHGELQDMGMTWARAGCLVLVPDQLGHGERRQHPFASAADFEKKFRVGPADYYFRYDNALQLHLLGESLMGCMVQDLSTAAAVLLVNRQVDPKRLILLGAVAGGGDPAAVTGALDARFTAVVPFNFGGPQPETRFPLPSEDAFNFAGSGSWESTRNLRNSAQDGFLPWLIVGSIAPRRLVYGHEFRWDQEHDPVWKRLQKIYEWTDHPENLDFTHGFGELKGQPPAASHCTHIGPPHRVMIHQAFSRWFGIEVTPESEYSKRLPSDQLRCWTAELESDLRPQSLATVLLRQSEKLIGEFRESLAGLEHAGVRATLRQRWQPLLGQIAPEALTSGTVIRSDKWKGGKIEAVLLITQSEARIPCLLFRPEESKPTTSIVVVVCSQGKERWVKESTKTLETLCQQGKVVCLCDPRGIGEAATSNERGRRSDTTAFASTEMMLGSTLLGMQLQDLRTVLAWVKSQPGLEKRDACIYGESLTPPNPDDAPFRQPRDSDQALPAPSQPQAALLALLAGLFEEHIQEIHTTGGLASWNQLFDSYLCLIAADAVVPGALTAGDISDLLRGQRGETKVHVGKIVDGWNRAVSRETALKLIPQASTSNAIRID